MIAGHVTGEFLHRTAAGQRGESYLLVDPTVLWDYADIGKLRIVWIARIERTERIVDWGCAFCACFLIF